MSVWSWDGIVPVVDPSAFVAAGARGVVLTGGDAEAVKRGQARGVVFVQSDRKGAGRVVTSQRQMERGVATSDNLPPHKARVLLRLADQRVHFRGGGTASPGRPEAPSGHDSKLAQIPLRCSESDDWRRVFLLKWRSFLLQSERECAG